jgi:hypothetical protein
MYEIVYIAAPSDQDRGGKPFLAINKQQCTN